MDERARRFKARLEAEMLSHPVIIRNPYTTWFQRGEFDDEHARTFLIQFSVFSNQFLVAQLMKMLSAETLAEMRVSKEILANELGVGFRKSGSKRSAARALVENAGPVDPASPAQDRETEDVLGSPEGTVDGGTFHFRAAHFELLVRMARQFDLRFGDLGRRRFGTRATLYFCDELIRLYGHEDYTVSAAASWAVENWAAAGFWDELIEGWRRYGAHRGLDRLDFGFFTWHARLEANHARHTAEEVEQFTMHRRIDEDLFVASAKEMLDGVLVFWRGLDRQRESFKEEVHHVG